MSYFHLLSWEKIKGQVLDEEAFKHLDILDFGAAQCIHIWFSHLFLLVTWNIQSILLGTKRAQLDVNLLPSYSRESVQCVDLIRKFVRLLIAYDIFSQLSLLYGEVSCMGIWIFWDRMSSSFRMAACFGLCLSSLSTNVNCSLFLGFYLPWGDEPLSQPNKMPYKPCTVLMGTIGSYPSMIFSLHRYLDPFYWIRGDDKPKSVILSISEAGIREGSSR